jgi:hypothetical protein
MHEYLFDVKLFAAIRVTAVDVQSAREAIGAVVDAMDPSQEWVDGYNSRAQKLRITEVSVAEDGDDENRIPVEIDGEFQ